jgi:hypothetical protein
MGFGVDGYCRDGRGDTSNWERGIVRIGWW